MGQTLVNDLMSQFRMSFAILDDEMSRFSPEQWTQGITDYLTPVTIAMHTLDCMDYFMRMGRPYEWGHRFAALPEPRQPDVAALRAYGRDLAAQAEAWLGRLSDDDLLQPLEKGHTRTVLGRCVYALRHTMHHQGQLAALNLHHGNEGGAWDKH